MQPIWTKHTLNTVTVKLPYWGLKNKCGWMNYRPHLTGLRQLGTKLQQALVKESRKCLKMCKASQFLTWVAGPRRFKFVSFKFWICKKISCDNFFVKIVTELSQSRRRCLKLIANCSWTIFDLVSVNRNLRENWDNVVRGWRPMKLNCDWLRDKNEALHKCRVNVVQTLCECLMTCMRI